MGRKSKYQKRFKAIIVMTENCREIIELNQSEKIKNLCDLARLPKMKKKKNNRKIQNISKTIKKCANINEVPSTSFKDVNSLFSEKSFFEDFTINGMSLDDFDFRSEKIDCFNF